MKNLISGSAEIPPISSFNYKLERREALQVLHRHDDAHLAIAVKSDDRFTPLFSMQTETLEASLESHRLRLEKDSFVSINAAYGTHKDRPNHKEKTLRYLCACYCDIDFYNLGRTFPETLQLVHDACGDGLLPTPSIVVNSGRGMWLLWLLCDANDNDRAHLGGWHDNPKSHLQLYRASHRKIGLVLAPFGSDSACQDAAKYIRIPGSLHTGSEGVVEWYRQTHSLPVYTLAELADALQIPASERGQPVRVNNFETVRNEVY